MILTAGIKCRGRLVLGVALLCGIAGLETGATASVPTVPLGRAASFAVLADTFVVNSGPSAITGDVGVSPGAVAAGFPPGTINGLLLTGNVASADAQADLTIAFNDAASRPPVSILPTDIGGLTLTTGVYQASSALEIASGDLTLDAGGNSAAVFIFQVPSTFKIAFGRRVLLTRGARAARIFWQVGSSAIVGASSVLKGNILANNSITIRTGANIEGRALSLAADVTIDTATVGTPSGGAGPSPPGLIVLDSPSAVTLNPQTGLLEQTVRIRNAGSNAVAAAHLFVKSLRTNVTVYNAVAKSANGHPVVQYNLPMAVNQSVDLVIEYSRPTRRPFPSPTFLTGAANPYVRAAPAGSLRAVLRTIPVGTDRMLVEFTTKPGRGYSVQYSDDRIIWKTAQPAVTASADRLFWLDYGAPKTEGTPTLSRTYRVIQLF